MAGIKAIFQKVIPCFNFRPARPAQGTALGAGATAPQQNTGARANPIQLQPTARGGGAPAAPTLAPAAPTLTPAAPTLAPAPAAAALAPPLPPTQNPTLAYELPLEGTNVDPWRAESYLNSRLGSREEMWQFQSSWERMTLQTWRELTDDEKAEVMRLAGLIRH